MNVIFGLSSETHKSSETSYIFTEYHGCEMGTCEVLLRNIIVALRILLEVVKYPKTYLWRINKAEWYNPKISSKIIWSLVI